VIGLIDKRSMEEAASGAAWPQVLTVDSLCWLLGTSVHKIRESRQYNRPHLPSCLHEKAYRSGNARTGKPMPNEQIYIHLSHQPSREGTFSPHPWKKTGRKRKSLLILTQPFCSTELASLAFCKHAFRGLCCSLVGMMQSTQHGKRDHLVRLIWWRS